MLSVPHVVQSDHLSQRASLIVGERQRPCADSLHSAAAFAACLQPTSYHAAHKHFCGLLFWRACSLADQPSWNAQTHTHTGVYVCSSSRAFNLSRLDKFATASQRKLHGSVAKFFAIAPRPLSNFSKVLLEISQLGPSLISTVIRFWPKHWSCLLILFGEQTLTV
jgi:hypothetical protein